MNLTRKIVCVRGYDHMQQHVHFIDLELKLKLTGKIVCVRGYDHMQHVLVHLIDIELKLNLTGKIVCVSGYARYQPSGRIINWSSARSAKLEHHDHHHDHHHHYKQIQIEQMQRFMVVNVIPDCW